MSARTRQLEVTRVRGLGHGIDADQVAIEAPLEIRLGVGAEGQRHVRAASITMRTPGHDDELAAGFLWSEGIVRQRRDIVGIAPCGTPDAEGSHHTIRVDLDPSVTVELSGLERHSFTSSSCGVCGKTSLEALAIRGAPEVPAGPRVDLSCVHGLPDRLRSAQAVFSRTGGLHAAGSFTADGELRALREDVGRHNALDKLVGHAVLSGSSLEGQVLVLSGRASFELIQKALMARVSFIVAVGAPSSLAVELAQEHGQTLIGFARDGRFNVYAGSRRLRGLG